MFTVLSFLSLNIISVFVATYSQKFVLFIWFTDSISSYSVLHESYQKYKNIFTPKKREK